MSEPTTTIEDALQAAAKAGIEIPTEVIIKAQATANLRREQLEKELEVSQSSKGKIAVLVEAFNRLYPKFLQTLIGIGDVMISLTQTLLIGIGVPVVLILLMIVEQQRVYRGMALFEVEASLAAFGASVLVICNLVFELLISWREHQAGWQEPRKYEFSFRLWARRLAYMFGRTSGWEPSAKSPAIRFKIVLRLITFSILMLALAGSMQSVIVKVDGNWYTAILSIFTKSTLLEFTTWAGGLLFAVAAVFSAQALSQYVAQKVIEIIAIMQSNIDDKPSAIASAAGLAGAMYILGYIKDATRQQRRAAALAADFDIREEVVRLPSARSQKQLTPAMENAVMFLKLNPGRIDRNTGKKLSLRQAALLAGVSYTTISNAEKYLESQQ